MIDERFGDGGGIGDLGPVEGSLGSQLLELGRCRFEGGLGLSNGVGVDDRGVVGDVLEVGVDRIDRLGEAISPLST